ncbi:MAG: dTDP-glucose 4,6-dehydratase [Candidatus Spechtbacterales bacterium]
MKLLVTGGSGFIGSNFIHYMLEAHPEHTVVNLDLLTYAGNPQNHAHLENNPNYRFVRGDIADAEVVNPLVKATDVVVHFAAESHVDRSILDPENFIRTNIVGTYTLLEAARTYGVKRFHHISTDEVFGALEPDDPPFNEETRYDPKSPYSASKASADHLVRAYAHTYGVPVTLSNCSNNYGPYHFPEKFIPLTITNLLESKKAPIYGDGQQVRDWLHVRDHCMAIDEILQRGRLGHTYCIGGGNQPTNYDIAVRIARTLGKDESWLEPVKDRPGHDRRYAIDFTKMNKDLQWQPTISLDMGLASTIQWYQQHTDWWQKVKSGAYQQYYALQYKQA